MLAIALTINHLNTSSKVNIIDVDLFLSPSVCCLQVTYFEYKDTRKLKINPGKKRKTMQTWKKREPD